LIFIKHAVYPLLIDLLVWNLVPTSPLDHFLQEWQNNIDDHC